MVKRILIFLVFLVLIGCGEQDREDPRHLKGQELGKAMEQHRAQMEASLVEIRADVAKFPENDEGWADLAYMLNSLGMNDEHLSLLNNRIQKTTDQGWKSKFLHSRGLHYELDGGYEKAISDMEAANDCLPSSVSALGKRLLYMATARVHEKMGNYAAAQAIMEEIHHAFMTRNAKITREAKRAVSPEDKETYKSILDGLKREGETYDYEVNRLRLASVGNLKTEEIQPSTFYDPEGIRPVIKLPDSTNEE